MKKSESTTEKICAFYASDYHFEMISLPYINKRIENNDEIIILTENNLEETMQSFLEKINLKENKKEKILKLNWKNNDVEKFEKIKEKLQEKKDMVVFIKGRKDYIHKINQTIEKIEPEENHIKIVDCYSIEEVGADLADIMEQYHKVLRTAGEKEIEK